MGWFGKKHGDFREPSIRRLRAIDDRPLKYVIKSIGPANDSSNRDREISQSPRIPRNRVSEAAPFIAITPTDVAGKRPPPLVQPSPGRPPTKRIDSSIPVYPVRQMWLPRSDVDFMDRCRTPPTGKPAQA